MTNTAQSVDLETIERLAEKVRALVGLLERTRTELVQTTEDNGKLMQEVEALRKQLANAQTDGAEVKTLLAEREQVRIRVSEMVDQLDAIGL